MAYSIDTTQYIDKLLTFCQKKGLNLNINNPKTIQDKLAWLNIYDTNPLKTKCADKVLVREYCKDVLNKDICIPIIKIYNTADDINYDELPNQFVIKCNHGSGMNIIVKDKSKIDKALIKRKLDKWLNEDFAFHAGFEAHYHDINHKILIEEYKTDHNNNLHDYKFWCFNGEPKFYSINDAVGHSPIIHYSMDQKQMSLERLDYPIPENLVYEQPKHFDKMVEYSKKLAKDFKFVRIDFYEINDKVYLGELTFTPCALFFRYKDPKDNIKIGEMLQL